MVDYKKLYEETFEKLQNIIYNHKKQGHIIVPIEDIENAFPELGENEDEKIRKALIEYFGEQCDMSDWNGVYGYQVFAWLKKQKSVDEIVERYKKSWYNEGKIDGKYEGITDDIKYQQGWHDALEKQGNQNLPSVNERAWLYLVADVLTWNNGIGQYLDDPRVQKLAKDLCSEYAQKLYNFPISSNSSNIGNNEQESSDTIKPKFHEGEWVINQLGYIRQIIDIKDNCYYCNCNGKGYCTLPIEYADEYWRKWTINDAKDGDVLATDKGVFIYAKTLYSKPYACCGIDKFGVFKDYCLKNNLANSADNIHPATKEQRDTLMKAMADAGYTFDFEKKELKEIEDKPLVIDEGKDEIDRNFTEMMLKGNTRQTPAWGREDEQNLNAVLGYINDEYLRRWLQDAIYNKYENHSEWSKEDETTRNNIRHIIWQYDKISKRNNQPCWYVGDCLLWMQNIKSRVQPQQEWSEEDCKRLQRIIDFLWHNRKGDTDTIYQQEQDINWLQFLPERFNLKPKQEWNTEMKELKKIKQKSIDIIKPKFHVGYWVTNNIETVQIAEYDIDHGYQVDYKGNLQHRDTDIVEKEYHLWTINDAKDGDILMANAPFIFNGNLEGGIGCPGAYCAINTLGKFQIPKYPTHWTGHTVTPATKEQRDLLFQKMKEAGYEWDAKKKKLKKISQRMISAEAKEALYDKLN